MENQTLTRQELYNLIWATPFIELTKRFSISNSALRKICTNMMIPFPEAGYWMKIKFNKPVIEKMLPENYSGPNEITFGDNDLNESKEVSVHTSIKLLEHEIIKQEGDNLIVPKKLTNPDKFIIEAKESLSKRNPNYCDAGIISTFKDETSHCFIFNKCHN